MSQLEELVKNVQLLRIGSRPRAFQRAINEVRKLPLIPAKSGSKSEFVVLVNTIQVQSNKVTKVAVEPFPYLTVYGGWR